MKNLYQKMAENSAGGIPFVLVTVIEKTGHGPAEPGAKMAVFRSGAAEGTIGGGAIEHLAKQAAAELFVKRGTQIRSYSMGEGGAAAEGAATGMVCGGTARLFFEYIGPLARLIIFGGGHVGRALIHHVLPLGWHITCVDTRPEILAAIQGITLNQTTGYAEAAQTLSLTQDDLIFVATHSHEFDFSVLKAIIAKPDKPLRLCVIASKKKAALFRERLTAELGEGWDNSFLSMPAGLDIGGSEPHQIALAVASEMLAAVSGKLMN